MEDIDVMLSIVAWDGRKCVKFQHFFKLVAQSSLSAKYTYVLGSSHLRLGNLFSHQILLLEDELRTLLDITHLDLFLMRLSCLIKVYMHNFGYYL